MFRSRSLESCLRSKDSRAVWRGAVGKGPQGTSLAAYPTSRTGLTGGMGRRTVRQRALCLPSDNCLAPKTGYNAPLSSHCEGAFCHDSTSILLSARGLRTPVAVCHAALRLAQPRCDDPDKASQAPHTAPPALHRAQTVCGPDAQAPLCTVCTRDWRDGSSASATARSYALNEPPPPDCGHLNALLPPPRV